MSVTTEQNDTGSKLITCVDCGNDFVFSVGEQRYFKEHQLKSDPKRCRDCRRAKRSQREMRERG